MKYGTALAETVTVAFWIKSNKTGTFQVNLKNAEAYHIGQLVTISSADTWEKKVITFVGDTAHVITNAVSDGIRIQFFFNAGSDSSGGGVPSTWQSTSPATKIFNGNIALGGSTSDNVFITGLQFEVGSYTSSTLPPFQHETFTESILRCHRYYIHGTGDTSLNPTAEAAAATTLQPTPQMRCAMRVAPTLTARPVGFIALIGGSGTTTTLSFSNMGVNGFRYGLNHDSSITTKQNIAMGGTGADMNAEL